MYAFTALIEGLQKKGYASMESPSPRSILIRELLTGVLTLFVLLAIACRGQAEAIPTEPSLLEDEIDITVLVNTMMGDSHITAGLVKNKTDHLYSFHYDLSYYDRRGGLLGTHQGIVQNLYPGVEQAFFLFDADDWTKAERVEGKVVNIISDEPSQLTPRFAITNVSAQNESYNTVINGEITNQDSHTYSIILVGGVFGYNDQLLATNIQAVDHLQPGETRKFKITTLGQDLPTGDARVYLSDITEAPQP